MLFIRNSVSRFILLSAAIHVLAVSVFLLISHQEQKLIPIEITFGTGPGGPSGVGQVAKLDPPPVVQKPVKPKAVTPRKVALSDAPAITNKEAELPQESAVPEQVGEAGVGGDGSGTHGHGDGGSPDGSHSPLSKYAQMIVKLINKHKKYPRMAYSLNQEGKVLVSLKLSKDGKIIDLKLLENSPFKSLGLASLETIKSIHEFPPIPAELEMNEISFSIPIEYKIEM